MSNEVNGTSIPTTNSSAVIWTPETTAAYTADMIFVSLGLFFHVLGILLILTQTKRKNGMTRMLQLTNQNILLLHLSCVSIIGIFANSVAIYHKTHRIKFPHYFIVIYFISYIAYIINLVYLSIDRVIFVVIPMKYRKAPLKIFLMIALLILWALSISYGLLMKYGKYINHSVWNKYSSFVYNGLVVLITMTLYLIIIYKINRSQSLVTSNRKRNLRKYIVPLLIVGTFVLFNIVPSIITSFTTFTRAHMIVLIGVNVLNYVSDAVIYILIQPSIYKHLKKSIRKLMNLLCPSRTKHVTSKDSKDKTRTSSQLSSYGTQNGNQPVCYNGGNIEINGVYQRNNSKTELTAEEQA